MRASRPVAHTSAVAERVRRRVTVHGRVQGVWFRDSCRLQAASLRLGGFVRNLEDGSVEAEFEGPAPAVERAVAWCRTGPPRAMVTAVDVTPLAVIGEQGFTVR